MFPFLLFIQAQLLVQGRAFFITLQRLHVIVQVQHIFQLLLLLVKTLLALLLPTFFIQLYLLFFFLRLHVLSIQLQVLISLIGLVLFPLLSTALALIYHFPLILFSLATPFSQ